MRGVKYGFVLLLGLTLLLCSCKPGRPKVPEGMAHARMNANQAPLPVLSYEGIAYKKLSDAVFDRKLLTKITISLLLEDGITREAVEALLRKYYYEAAARRGFQYHTRATDIFICAFLSEEHAASQRNQWLAMISKTQTDSEPRLQFDEVQLAQLHAPKVERFGLSDEQRRILFRDVMLQDDAAQSRGGETNHWRDSIAQHHNLSRADLDSLAAEGLQKHWAMPPMPESW